MNKALLGELRRTYRWCESAPDRALDELIAGCALLELPAGSELFAVGSACERFPLVLDGSIRVRRLSAAGKELLLYRVGRGESCILTSSCLLGESDYSASAVTETAVRLLALPRTQFMRLLDENRAFRSEVFHLFAARLSELMLLVDAVAFQRLDQRLARRLLSGPPAELQISHQQLAAELGSVREIVSRLLGDFQDRGLVRLGRGHIQVLDEPALKALAEGT